MYKNEQRCGRSKRPPLLLILFWCAAGIITLFRAGYDITLYFYGGTIAVHGIPPYNYLIHLPAGYSDFGSPHPLIIFLHGAGEIKTDFATLNERDAAHYAAGRVTKEDFPFIMISPIAPDHGWNEDILKNWIKKMIRSGGSRLKIDPNRVYLTGFSMGGGGTFNTAESSPDLFAAIASVAGYGDKSKADRLISLPIRAYHGNNDETVSYQRSVEMIDAVKKAGNSDAELITIPGGKHDIRPDVYGCPEIYRWLLQHKRDR